MTTLTSCISSTFDIYNLLKLDQNGPMSEVVLQSQHHECESSKLSITMYQSFSSSFPSSFIDFPSILAISPFLFPGLSRFQPPNVHQDESPNATPWALPRSHPATIYQMHCVVTSGFVLIASNSCSIFILSFIIGVVITFIFAYFF